MSLSFLVDESSGFKIYKFLLEKGFNTKFVGEIMSRAPDEEVLALADKENRILITNDKDFGELIFRLNKPSSGVILLRLNIDSPNKMQKYVEETIKILSNKLKSSFVVVTEGQIRVRKI